MPAKAVVEMVRRLPGGTEFFIASGHPTAAAGHAVVCLASRLRRTPCYDALRDAHGRGPHALPEIEQLTGMVRAGSLLPQ